MPVFPSIDLTKLDLSKLDLSKLDLSKLDAAGVDVERLRDLARDAAYVTIGLGVLTFQQAQVRRRDLTAALDRLLEDSAVARQLGITKDSVDRATGSARRTIGEQLDQLAGRLDDLEAKLDEAVEKIESRLPEQAGSVVGQAHELAKSARSQVRGLLRGVA